MLLIVCVIYLFKMLLMAHNTECLYLFQIVLSIVDGGPWQKVKKSIS